MTDTGLIVTVVIFCLIFAWIITFSILAMVLKKPIFSKLSLIGPLGFKVYTKAMGFSEDSLNQAIFDAKSRRMNDRIQQMKENQEKLAMTQQKQEQALLKAQQKQEQALLKAQQKQEQALLKAQQKINKPVLDESPKTEGGYDNNDYSNNIDPDF